MSHPINLGSISGPPGQDYDGDDVSRQADHTHQVQQHAVHHEREVVPAMAVRRVAQHALELLDADVRVEGRALVHQLFHAG